MLINGRPAHRLGDMVKHCGGIGNTIAGSSNVIVGDNAYSIKKSSIENNSWIRVRVINHNGEPVCRESYTIEFPDGSTYSGMTDDCGLIFLNGIKSGTCRIEFPNALDGDCTLK